MGLKAQVIFVTLTVAGLLTLILAGILTPGSQVLGAQATAPGIMIQDRSILFLALVLWVGFDLGALTLDQNTDRPGKSKKLGPLVWTIGAQGYCSCSGQWFPSSMFPWQNWLHPVFPI